MCFRNCSRPQKCVAGRVIAFLFVVGFAFETRAAVPSYDIEEAVRLAQTQNIDIAIAHRKIHAALGGVTEARSGFLPAVVSSGLLRQREHQTDSRLRDEDYSASLRLVQNLYTGGAVSNQLAIARLNLQIQELELESTASRVAMEVRIAFNELLLNRAKIQVRQESVKVLQEEVKSQEQRFNAGTVGQLDVRRAEVALANDQPQLIEAQTQLKNSYLRLEELFGTDAPASAFEARGELEFHSRRPNVADCLARAEAERPEIKVRRKQIEIEERQANVDRSAMRPQVEAFSGYEVYNERDPLIGREFNHGYVVGLNARWNIFDGFATKGRLAATRARREAAVQALKATELSVASEVRSAMLDLEQANRTLGAETKNVQSASESLEIARANLGAGVGTQLDILQAATDLTRTRTIRLTALFQQNAALARLARACAAKPILLETQLPPATSRAGNAGLNVVDLAEPPAKLNQP